MFSRENFKKLTLLIIIFSLLVFGGFNLWRFYEKEIGQQGGLNISVYPSQAALKIKGQIYYPKNGLFKLNLPIGKYNLEFSYLEYSPLEKEIEIKPREIVFLGKIYLFPLEWVKENIIEERNIRQFYLDKSNRFVYLLPSDKGYDWYFFERNLKQKTKFYQNAELPLVMEFSPASKKVIVRFPKNEWKTVFLPKGLPGGDININSRFLGALKQANVAIGKKSLVIEQIVFIPERSDNKVILRTKSAVYLFDFIETEIKEIISAEISHFIFENNNLYYAKENGLLFRFDLENFKEEEISLFSFKNQNESLENIKIYKAKAKNIFLVVDSQKKSYLLEKKQDLPLFITDETTDAEFSPEAEKILLGKENNKILIYQIESGIMTEENIPYASMPVWFLDNNHLLFTGNKNLNAYSLETKKASLIDSELENKNFFYDPSLNYIFYLTKEGIKKTSF